MKKTLFLVLGPALCLGILLSPAFTQKKQSNAQIFFDSLKKHCGNAYEGKAVSGGDTEPFKGNKLVMHVRSCKKNEIKIPFFVGEDKSRTWILTMKGGKILLKHDHRHEDGSSDKITMYGGLASNTGFSNLQVFPADQETVDLIDYTAANIWWMTTDDKKFSYNLRRMGSDRLFSVEFDYSKKIEPPSAPWGWKD